MTKQEQIAENKERYEFYKRRGEWKLAEAYLLKVNELQDGKWLLIHLVPSPALPVEKEVGQ